MTNLNEIKLGINQHCGPAVISALTGRDTDECAEAIKAATGKTTVTGTSIGDLIKTLEKLRFTTEKIKVNNDSLYSAILHLSDSENAAYIIGVPKHWIAIEVKDKKVYLVDNTSKAPFNAGASARLTQQVDTILKVVPKDPPKFIRSEIQIKSAGLDYIKIYRVGIFKDEKDNIKVGLGSFSFKDMTELIDIMEAIEEYYHDRTRG